MAIGDENAEFTQPRAHLSNISKSRLDAHFPARDDVGDDVLRGRVGVDAVGPLADGDDVAALLVRVRRLARLVDERATRKTRHLQTRRRYLIIVIICTNSLIINMNLTRAKSCHMWRTLLIFFAREQKNFNKYKIKLNACNFYL